MIINMMPKPNTAPVESCICLNCGAETPIAHNAGSDMLPLCEQCGVRCAACGTALIRELAYRDGNGEAYCLNCFRDISHDGVQNYTYKPRPIFYGEGTRYFGVELEVDGAGESDDNADAVTHIANYDENRVYCKHDGSLDNGFEIVTHPMTLRCHEEQMPWALILDELKCMGYMSHQTETCGLHVHVNRNSLGATVAEQETAIAKILYFLEAHWDEMLRFSRRNGQQMEKWASRYGKKDDPKEVLKSAKTSCKGRYTCVNLTNDSTIEFRMFRGTLRYTTLIAAIQLVDKICDAAASLSDEQIKSMTWSEFASGISQQTMPELILYLKQRRLYVNDPIDDEEEV